MRAFRLHIAIYLVATIVLIGANFILAPQYLYVVWPLLFWGAGVAVHAAIVMGLMPGGRK